MLKVNDPTEFEDGYASILSLQKESLEKTAACDAIKGFIATLSPKPGHAYLHINTLGSSETYGPTKNGDFFSEDTLRKYHKTFETNPAKFFKHHHNKNGAPHYGEVIFSTFNENMKRIELIVEVDEETTPEINSLIAQGKFPKVSMACRLPMDRCSICDNEARTRNEYCNHLKYEMGKIYPDGRRVYAINEKNISWFDCSWVIVPADPTASVLVKVAGADVNQIVGSAERAEKEGFSETPLNKQAAVVKLAELIKQISEGVVLDKLATDIVDKTADLPLKLAKALANFETHHVLHELASLGISPSLAFIAEMIAIRHLGEKFEGIGPIAESYAQVADGNSPVSLVNFSEPTETNPMIKRVLSDFVSSSSLFPDAIEKRASQVGYFGNGPHVEPTLQEEHREITEPKVESFISQNKGTLLGLIGSALLAKWYISKQIEKQMKQSGNNVKIVIIKKASDYTTASQFSKIPVASLNQQRANDTGGVTGSRLAVKVTRSLLKSTNVEAAKKVSDILKAGQAGLAYLA